jgi:Na+/H+-translocating membrane pyrophosphatase
MIWWYSLGWLGIVMFVIAGIIYKKLVTSAKGPIITESFVVLLTQSLSRFNMRLFFILVQGIVIVNLAWWGISYMFKQPISIAQWIAFDSTVLLFCLVSYSMLQMFPFIFQSILTAQNQSYKHILKHIIYAGFFQTMVFFGAFISMIYFVVSVFGVPALIAMTCGMLVLSFYYRAAGGAYKAAAENNIKQTEGPYVITHPESLLKRTGHLIATMAGYYLDIFSSWIIAIATFFMYISIQLNTVDIFVICSLPDVQWVLSMLVCTGIAIVISMAFVFVRHNVKNIFLEIGYLIIGLSYIGIVSTAYYLNLEAVHIIVGYITVALLGMVGVAFFTNYLTSSHHRPMRFICEQAQHGGANVLISSFFNGLMGNAIFTFLIVLILIGIGKALGIIGVLMVMIYALSIAAIACSIKVFSVVSNQLVSIIESDDHPLLQTHSSALKAVSYTLVSIGNSFSSAAGVLSSIAILVPVVSQVAGNISIFSTDCIFGFGLGIVAISIFYAFTISGTYTTRMASIKEISRQLSEIPHINEKDKAHPNMLRLADQHAMNGLKAVTLPGVWIVFCILSIMVFLSGEGVFGALLGMFLTVFIQSFFWSIFGDSIASVHTLMSDGLYGGKKSSVFKSIDQAYIYAHYFQWVLAPTGGIIMKFVGVVMFSLFLL